MSEHAEWWSVRYYLIDRMTAAHLRVQWLEKHNATPSDLQSARENLDQCNKKLADHERNSP
jgi:hypothetical protein